MEAIRAFFMCAEDWQAFEIERWVDQDGPIWEHSSSTDETGTTFPQFVNEAYLVTAVATNEGIWELCFIVDTAQFA